MTTYFVSRHPGAKDWAAQRGFVIDRQLTHLDPDILEAGDRVIGTLPIHLVEAVCARQARYLHLTLDVPETWRGRDLSAQDMDACQARLQEYRALRVAPAAPPTADQRQLFIAIATGQAVSNLPPILEYAQPGDAVLWVESPQARQENWTGRVNPVLEQFGLTIRSPNLYVNDINDPVEMQRITRSSAANDLHWRPVIVTNGGQKLSPIGLLNAWEPRHPVILYGNVPEVCLRIFPSGLQEPPQDRPYERHQLDLEEILRCSSHARFRPDLYPAAHLWPGDVLPPAPEYGADPNHTHQIHDEHYRYALQNKATTALPTFNNIIQLNKEDLLLREMKKWRGALLDFFRQIKNGSRCCPPEDFLDSKPDTPASLYNATRNLIQAATRQENGALPPSSHLGQLFEQAVAYRLIVWLRQWPQTRRVLQSVWSNIHVCHESTPHTQVAEWDIVLVLRNGLLVSIECKSFDANQKDLDARLLKLQKASSNLASMVICAPLYTGFIKEEWFAPMHRLKNKVETASRFTFLPFTLPDQPPDYPTPGQSSRRQHCLSFEAALEKLLKGYVP